MISKKASAKKHGTTEAAQTTKTMIPLAEIVVNLADSGEAHYAKTTIVLEVSGSSAKTEVDEATAQIRDAVISALSSRYFADLLSTAGKNALKLSIKKKINAVLHQSQVVSVYFSDFAMQ